MEIKKIGFVTPRQISADLGIRYIEALELVRTGSIKAEKINFRWHIDPKIYNRFRLRNEKALKKLKLEYIGMYRSGLSVKSLQQRVDDDMCKRRIVAERRNFAEQLIYSVVMEEMI